MRIVLNRIAKALELFIIVAVAGLVLVVLWGVLSRFVISVPSRWTEELATYLLSWVALLGSALAFRNQQHLGVDVLINKLHPDAQRWSAIIVQLIVILFAVLVLVYGGSGLVAQTWVAGQVTPALGLPMGVVYLAAPLGGLLILLFASEQLFDLMTSPTYRSLSDSSTESLNVD